MALENKIARIQNNVSDALAALAENGEDVPEGATSNDLGRLIRANGLSVVRTTAQTFDEAQKTQARTNIGAASSETVNQLSKEIDDQQTEIDGKQPKGNYALKSELTAEATAREQAVADLNARLGQQTLLIAEGETQEEAEAWLESDADKTKVYLMPDDTFWQYKKTTEVVEGGARYKNVLPTAKDKDGSIYNGIGYRNGYRWSDSSNEIKSGAATQGVTGRIACENDDVVRVKDYSERSGNAWYIVSFDASGNKIKSFTPYNKDVLDGDIETGYFAVKITEALFGSGVASVLFSLGTFSENSIVTVNEEIVEGSGTTTVVVEKWTTTGHRLTATNYDAIISELNRAVTAHTAEINELREIVESGKIGEPTDEEKLARIKVWDKPVYDSAPLTMISEDRAKPALPESERTVAAVYAKYRALMARHPDYITETNLGLSSSSDTFAAVDMLRFDFKERDGRVEPGYKLNETKPKIIVMTGVHLEYAGIYGMYYALEEIAENPEFRDIRRNAHIIVIPCANPHCLGGATKIDGWQMSHVNANGVAIHNNFGVEFGTTNASATLGEYNYGGTEPYSEPETQYIDKVMRDNSDAIAFISCHNFNYGVKFASDFVWMSSATAYMCNLGFRLIDKLTTAWIDKYGEVYKDNFDAYRNEGTETYADGDYRIGRATFSTSAGTEQLNATKYGIVGTNLEIGDRIRVLSGNTTYTSETMTRGAEVYANFLRTVLAAYSYTDKEAYYK